jgi:hypothetical protein
MTFHYYVSGRMYLRAVSTFHVLLWPVPICCISCHDFRVWLTLQKVYTDAPQGIDTPFGVTFVPIVPREEASEVVWKCPVDYCIPRTTHEPCLKDEVVDCHSWRQE